MYPLPMEYCVGLVTVGHSRPDLLYRFVDLASRNASPLYWNWRTWHVQTFQSKGQSRKSRPRFVQSWCHTPPSQTPHLHVTSLINEVLSLSLSCAADEEGSNDGVWLEASLYLGTVRLRTQRERLCRLVNKGNSQLILLAHCPALTPQCCRIPCKACWQWGYAKFCPMQWPARRRQLHCLLHLLFPFDAAVL